MSALGIAVYGEGKHELGGKFEQALSPDSLPSLPRLVQRLLEYPQEVAYTCRRFKDVPAVHTRGQKFAKKVIRAIRQAKRDGFTALAIVIDRDGKPDRERIHALRGGRDALPAQEYPPCAVGTPVEAFDAWMIVDPKAVQGAGGDHRQCHAHPEKLNGKEETGRHPKDIAGAIFGGKRGLGSKYAAVAEKVDLGLLGRKCPKGFAPFAKEVQTRILPVVS